MRLRRWLTPEMVLLSGVLLCAASCSVIFDTDQVQCEVREDCAGFKDITGVQTAKCVQGVCAYEYATTSTGGTGGTGGNPTSTTSPGTSNNTTSNNSTTGSAGAGGVPECVLNDDCIDELDNPSICRDGECIDLHSTECPVVLGAGTDNENLRSPREPLIFGAYSGIGEFVAKNHVITANFEFAIDEVNEKTAGGFTIAGKHRPFVAVVCDVAEGIPESMQHLVKTLQVPGIISTMDSQTLLDVFENPDYGASKNNVFLLSALGADSTLTNPDVDPNQLMWHMLGEPADMGLAYKPLVAQAEALIREQQGIPPEDPIKVAMVVADITPLQDIASVIQSTVVFNGLSVTDNGDNFQRIGITSYLEEDPPPDLGDAFVALRAMKPHIILAITTTEFMYDQMLPALESSWDNTETIPPPFYLLSPYISRNAVVDVLKRFEDKPVEPGNPTFSPLRQRLLGVTAAGSDNTTLYDEYLLSFKDEYGYLEDEGWVLEGKENFYDAAYFMMDAIHGGGTITDISGRDLSRGMRRLLGGEVAYDVGRRDAYAVIDELWDEEETDITLNGTLGPPDFSGSGARASVPSVHCYDFDSEDVMTYYPDVLKYNMETGLLEGPDPCSIVDFMMETP